MSEVHDDPDCAYDEQLDDLLLDSQDEDPAAWDHASTATEPEPF